MKIKHDAGRRTLTMAGGLHHHKTTATAPDTTRARTVMNMTSTVQLWVVAIAMVVVMMMAESVDAATLTKGRLMELREEARTMFRHGFDNYMLYGFPADEIKPISCTTNERTRPPEQGNLGLDDVLGNFSLTAIDTLSTLGMFAESSGGDRMRFWRTVEELRVRFYPGEKVAPPASNSKPTLLSTSTSKSKAKSGRKGKGKGKVKGSGVRKRRRGMIPEMGFDIDSRVQVFEATIRALGGLISAHLYAIGEFGGAVLPVPETLELSPAERSEGSFAWFGRSGEEVRTSGAYTYDGHLLDLAHDLGERLLPALETSASGIPYARVNLRRGLHFEGAARDERNGTCPAGAGSLVLEFAALSRLTGDGRFEAAAGRAFSAVWKLRSGSGLVGAGIDVGGTTGSAQVVEAYSGIGAGLDSFFEYAFKAHVLLDNPAYHNVWTQSHAAISRHILRHNPTPHYLNVHYSTGAAVLPWIDSLSAFYPGLLVLAGNVAEAEDAHLFYTALWQRYAALPERWNIRTAQIDGGLGWWPGRPEFIESTYMLHRATGDEWYLKVGEMTLQDIKLRCYSRCGWAGLQSVESGEKADRMESFVLGETLQYLFLLFDSGVGGSEVGWLNGNKQGGDGNWVFTTEGHPIVIPRGLPGPFGDPIDAPATQRKGGPGKKGKKLKGGGSVQKSPQPTCENPRARSDVPPPAVFLRSPADVVEDRPDIFHATYLTHARLPLSSYTSSGNGVFTRLSESSVSDGAAAAINPEQQMCSLIPVALTQSFDLIFPEAAGGMFDAMKPKAITQNIMRLQRGVVLQSLAGLRLGFEVEQGQQKQQSKRKKGRGGYDNDTDDDEDDTDDDDDDDDGDGRLRITKVNNVSLGRDEKVYMPFSLLKNMWHDENFVIRERGGGVVVDFIVDIGEPLKKATEKKKPKAVDVLVAQPTGLNKEGGEKPAAKIPFNPDLPGRDSESATVPTQNDQQEIAAGAGNGFWTSGAQELREQVRSLQRELEKLFDTNYDDEGSFPVREPNPNAPSHRKHHHGNTNNQRKNTPKRLFHFPALTASGPVVGPIPNSEAEFPPSRVSSGKKIWPPPEPRAPYTRVWVPPEESECACTAPLRGIPRDTQVIVVRRGGGCTFARKIRNLPIPGLPSLRVVVFVDFTGDEDAKARGEWPPVYVARDVVRPMVDLEAVAGGKGKIGGGKVGVVMVGGGRAMWEGLKRAKGVGLERRWEVRVGGGVMREDGGGGGGGGAAGAGEVDLGWPVENLRVVRG